MITQSELKERVKYDPETGLFIRIGKTRPDHIGRVAGYLFESGTKNCKKLYVRMKVSGVNYLAHRLAFLYMTGSIPENVDHDDGDGTNNRWNNLNASNPAHNSKNKRKMSTNKTGIAGVYLSHGKYQAAIGNDRLIRTGDFFEACCVRKSAELKRGYSASHGTDRPL